MKLKVISPETVVYEGDVDSVTLPGELGAFTVLKNHASLISTLTAGKLTYNNADSPDDVTIEIDGGLVDVDNNIISVCLY